MRWKSQVDNLRLLKNETELGVNGRLASWIERLPLERDAAAAALACRQSLQ